MGVTVKVKNFGPGRFAVVNGKKIGAFQFTRDPVNYSEHVLNFETAEAFNARADELLATRGNPQMFVRVTPEIAPEDAALKEAILVAQKTATDAEAKVAELTQALEKTKHELGEATKGNGAGGALSEGYLDMLAERDELLKVLEPCAREGETPLACLTRLMGCLVPGWPPAELQPHEQNRPAVSTIINPLTLPYEAMLKFAKETLGLVYKTKPGKAQLLEDVKANLRA